MGLGDDGANLLIFIIRKERIVLLKIARSKKKMAACIERNPSIAFVVVVVVVGGRN